MPGAGGVIRGGSTSAAATDSVSADLQAILDYQTAQNELAFASAKQQQEAQAKADQIAMQFTHDENELAWQRQMEASNTAYQRSVADMKKAGLNPILALGSPASTPSSSGGHGVSSARQAAQLNLDNVVASFKSLVRELEQSDTNAKTAAAAQKYSADKSYDASRYRTNMETALSLFDRFGGLALGGLSGSTALVPK